MKKSNLTSKQKIRRLTAAAVLSALSIVLMLTVRFSIFPSAPFYEMEFSDVPMLISSSLLGPVYAIVSLLVVCIIQATTVSASSGIIGFFMHFISSGFMILVMCFFRKKIKGVAGVIISNIFGIIVMTLIMIPMNLWMVGVMMNVDAKTFVDSFLLVCVGFNLIKSTLNVTVYSFISPILNKEFSKLLGKSDV